MLGVIRTTENQWRRRTSREVMNLYKKNNKRQENFEANSKENRSLKEL